MTNIRRRRLITLVMVVTMLLSINLQSLATKGEMETLPATLLPEEVETFEETEPTMEQGGAIIMTEEKIEDEVPEKPLDEIRVEGEGDRTESLKMFQDEFAENRFDLEELGAVRKSFNFLSGNKVMVAGGILVILMIVFLILSRKKEDTDDYYDDQYLDGWTQVDEDRYEDDYEEEEYYDGYYDIGIDDYEDDFGSAGDIVDEDEW